MTNKIHTVQPSKKAFHIGLVEYHCHAIDLYTLCKMCLTSKTKVTVFTTKKIWNVVLQHLNNPEEYNVVFQREKENWTKFVKRVEKLCDEYEIKLLFIQTIQGDMTDLPRFKDFNPKAKIILTLHSINAWLNNKNVRWNLTKPLEKPVHVLDFIVRPLHVLHTIISSRYIRKYILPKVDGFTVATAPISDYVQSLDCTKPVFVVPAWLYANKKEKGYINTNKNHSIVVAGSYDEKRRDYNLVFDAFENVLCKRGNKVQLVLLGTPRGSYGKQVIKRALELRSKGLNIVYFTEFIPEKEYNDWVENCDFLLCPIRLKTWSEGVIEEIAGISKGSSGPLEAVRNVKPLIVPRKYKIPPELASSTLEYKDVKDLQLLIEGIINNPKKVNEFNKEAVKNAKKFSLPILQKYFEDIILEKMKVDDED